MQSINSYTIKIPFCGFHESEADDAILTAIETVFDSSIPDDFWNSWDHRPVSVAFAEHYTQLFTALLKDKAGLDIRLFFEELDSPRFYDEETDKIYCKISAEDLEKLWHFSDKEEFKRTVEDYTDSSPPETSEINKDEWLKPVTEWGLEQLEVLLWTVLRQSNIEEINYEEMFKGSQEINRIVWGNCSSQCLEMVGKHEERNRA